MWVGELSCSNQIVCTCNFCIVQLLYPPCKRIGNISCRIIPETDIDDHRVHVTVFSDSSTVRLVLHLKRFVTNVNL